MKKNSVAFSIALLICLIAAAAHATFDGWRRLPNKSQDEYTACYETTCVGVGGEGVQHSHGIARSRSSPSVIYLSHDCSGVWRSDDGGSSWQHRMNYGLGGWAGGGVEVDPVNSNVVLTARFSGSDVKNQSDFGLYRSVDGGEHFTRVISKPGIDQVSNRKPNRNYQHTIAYALSSADETGAAVWYAALYDYVIDAGKIYVYRSADYGVTWTLKTTLATAGNVAFDVQVHPTNSAIVYLGSSGGFYKSTDSGATFSKIGSVSSCTSIAIDEQTPANVYAVMNKDLYKSTNTGGSFSLLRSYGYGVHVFINNPTYTNQMYMVGDNTNVQSIHASNDHGATWYTSPTVTNAPGLERQTAWGQTLYGQVNGNSAGVSPHPTSEDEAIIYSKGYIFKTVNGGQTITASSTGWGGHNCNDIAWDVNDANRWMAFAEDKSAILTTTGGNWFEYRRGNITSWYPTYIPWYNGVAGDIQPVSESDRLVGAFGDVWNHRVAYTTNEGTAWSIGTNVTSNTLVLHAKYHRQNTSIAYVGNRKSTDGGTTWSSINFGAYATNSPTVFGVCNADSDIVYAIARSDYKKILRSADAGANWSLYTTAAATQMPGTSRASISLDPTGSCNKIYGLDANRDVAVYNGSSWSSLNALSTVELGGRWAQIGKTVVDPSNASVIYATVIGAQGVSNVLRSADAGASWTDVSYNLPRRNVRGLSVSPHTGEVIASSCFGMFVLPPPYSGSTPIYDKGLAVASCFDGIQNGNETGVDTGGACGGGDPPPADTTPPVLTGGGPTGTIVCNSDPRNVTISMASDEAATLRLSETDQAYDDMSDAFDATGGTAHSEVKSIACGSSKTYYVRGADGSGNKNTSSTIIAFAVAAAATQTETRTLELGLSGGNLTINLTGGSLTIILHGD